MRASLQLRFDVDLVQSEMEPSNMCRVAEFFTAIDGVARPVAHWNAGFNEHWRRLHFSPVEICIPAESALLVRGEVRVRQERFGTIHVSNDPKGILGRLVRTVGTREVAAVCSEAGIQRVLVFLCGSKSPKDAFPWGCMLISEWFRIDASFQVRDSSHSYSHTFTKLTVLLHTKLTALLYAPL